MIDPWLIEAKRIEYPLNGSSTVLDGNKFMRIAVCNRKVVDCNNRPVYHIDNDDPLMKDEEEIKERQSKALKEL